MSERDVTNTETKDMEIARLKNAMAKLTDENYKLREALANYVNFAAVVINAQAMLRPVRFE